MVTKNLRPRKSPAKAKQAESLKRKDHLSYSQLREARCLLRYKETVLKGKYYSDNEFMRFGSLCHTIIYEYTKACVANRVDSDFDLINALIDTEFKKSKLSESWYQLARENMLDFAERGINPETILDFERKFEVSVAGVAVYHGVIDRVDGWPYEDGSCLDVLDYKSQMAIMSQTEVIEDEQLRIYRYVALRHLFPGFNYVRWGIYHTRYGFIRWSGPPQRVSELSKDFENTEAYLLRMWDRVMKAEEYPAERGPQCWEYGGCPLMLDGKCPLYTKEEIAKKINLGPIDEKVRALRRLDLDVKRLTEEIKAAMVSREPFDVDGTAVGFFAHQSYKYDLEKFLDFARTHDIPLSGITISKTDAEKAVKRKLDIKSLDEDQYAHLDAAKEETQGTTFKYK